MGGWYDSRIREEHWNIEHKRAWGEGMGGSETLGKDLFCLHFIFLVSPSRALAAILRDFAFVGWLCFATLKSIHNGRS